MVLPTVLAGNRPPKVSLPYVPLWVIREVYNTGKGIHSVKLFSNIIYI